MRGEWHISRIVLGLVSLLGVAGIFSYIYHETRGFRISILRAFAVTGHLGDLWLLYIYSLIILTVVATVWTIKGVKLNIWLWIPYLLLISGVFLFSYIMLSEWWK